jgi:glucosamine-phosphate N-acetyltransferase
MTLRTASKDDLKNISKLVNKGFKRLNKEINNCFFDNPNILCFVAEVENEIVGTATLNLLQKIDRVAGLIEDVVVDENYKKQGIGSALIKELIKHAKSNNCYKVMLNCKVDNIGFYEKLNFESNEIQMVKRF